MTEQTKKIAADKKISIEDAETKKIGISETRAKKIKHSYDVKDPENAIVMKLKDGDVVIEMFPEVAPKHVERIKELVRSKFYDGLKFHRVIEGFMAQAGCPLGTGTGGSGKKIVAEFSDLPHKRGTLSMARAMDPNSGDSQFFICFNNCEWLDGQYTIWGQVKSGMEYVDNIKLGSGQSGMVTNPDTIVTIEVIADL